MIKFLLYFLAFSCANYQEQVSEITNKNDQSKEETELSNNISSEFFLENKKHKIERKFKDKTNQDIINRLEPDLVPGYLYLNSVELLPLDYGWMPLSRVNKSRCIILDKKNRKEYKDFLNIVSILYQNNIETNDISNLTFRFISDNDKPIDLYNFADVKNMIYQDTRQIKFSIVIKISIRINASIKSVSLDILLKKIENILRNMDKTGKYSFEEINNFYDLKINCTSSNLTNILLENWQDINKLNVKKTKTFPPFNMLFICSNTILDSGINRLLVNIKDTVISTGSDLSKISCLIVASRTKNILEDHENEVLKKFINHNDINLEIQKPCLHEHTILEYSTKNINMLYGFSELLSNEITLKEILDETTSLKYFDINFSRRIYPCFILGSFKLFNTNLNSEFYENEYFFKIENYCLKVDEMFNFQISFSMRTENKDIRNVKKYMTFKKCIQEHCSSSQYIKKLRKYPSEDVPLEVFDGTNLEFHWKYDEIQNKLSDDNTVDDINNYRKSLVFLKNIKLMMAFFGINILSDYIVKFETLLVKDLKFLTKEISFYLPNMGFSEFTNDSAITFVLEKLNLNPKTFSYVAHIYDLNKNICKTEKPKPCNFLKKEIPYIQDYDFFENEMCKYQNVKILSSDARNDYLGNNKGLLLKAIISERNTCYVTLRYYQSATIELDFNEKIFLQDLKEKINKCIEKDKYKKYIQYFPGSEVSFETIRIRIWEGISKIKDFLKNYEDFPEPDLVNQWVLSILNPKQEKILFRISKWTAKRNNKLIPKEPESCFYNNFDFVNELNNYKMDIFKVISDTYIRIYNEKNIYSGFFYSYFFRTSETEMDGDRLKLKESFFL